MDKFKFEGAKFETEAGLSGYNYIALEVCQWVCKHQGQMVSDISKNIKKAELKFDLNLILGSYLQMAIAYMINDRINVVDPDNVENVRITFCQLARESGVNLFECAKCESVSICSMADLGPMQ